MTATLLVALVVGYLLGSIPFGLILTRAAGLGDVRKIGSGNIGATNVLRTGNKGLAAATLLLDALKGTAAVLLGPVIALALFKGSGETATFSSLTLLLVNSAEAQLAAGYGAFLGHLYPVWLGFTGGKGVATYIGVLLGLFWKAAAAFCVVWLVLAVLLRYSSLSALVASVAAPIVTFGLGRADLAVMLLPLTALLFWSHRANIQRLMSGKEPRIGARH